MICGCDNGSIKPEVTGSMEESPHDGKILFRGLYFGHSPVAKKLPEIWNDLSRQPIANATAVEWQHTRMLQEKFIDHIESNMPKSFCAFC